MKQKKVSSGQNESTGYADLDPIPEVRKKPLKSDQELLEEYFGGYTCRHRSWSSSQLHWVFEANSCGCQLSHDERKATIEAELGKDKIQDERIRRLEEKTGRHIVSQWKTNKTFLMYLIITVIALAISLLL